MFAERLDEIGAQVFSADVSFDSVPSPAPSSPPLSPAPSELALPPSSAHIVLADGELVAKPGIHSLPMELLHLIVLHMLPDVDTINKIGTINRYAILRQSLLPTYPCHEVLNLSFCLYPVFSLFSA